MATAYIRSRHPYNQVNLENGPHHDGHEPFNELMRGRFGENWRLLDWQPDTRDVNSSWWSADPEDNNLSRPIPTTGLGSVASRRVTGTLQEAENAATTGRSRRAFRQGFFPDPLADGAAGRRHDPSRSMLQLIRSDQSPGRFASISARRRERREQLPYDLALSAQQFFDPMSGGLGDRNRSMSPEWDTLLSTLTPDPQPPSAGSSFASTATSRNNGSANNSSSTSLSHQATGAEAQGDQPCEPGRENSDEDDENMNTSPPDAPRNSTLNERPPHTFARATPSEIDALRRVGGPNLDFIGEYTPIPRDIVRREVARREGYRSWQSDFISDEHDAALRESDEAMLRRYERRAEEAHREARAVAMPDAWSIQVSIGANDAPQRDDANDTAGEVEMRAAGSPSNAVSGEEDLTGIRAIVSHLAQREDVPEDWWAQVGLSRTLSNAHRSNESNEENRNSDGDSRSESRSRETR